MKQNNKKRVLKPKVKSGGRAIALGSNYYYMQGNKHEQGGIKVGKNAKNGLEVEDGEVMHLTDKNAKVFSAVPMLRGDSPANKVIRGEDPQRVFKEQEDFKDDNNLKDDGSMKKRNGGEVTIYGKAPKKRLAQTKSKLTNDFGVEDIRSNYIDQASKKDIVPGSKYAKAPALSNTKGIDSSIVNNYKTPHSTGKGQSSKFADFAGNIGDNASDLIGLTGNIAGSLLSYGSNRSTLKKMKAPNAPVLKRAAKLKTNININPQLDRMREDAKEYERSINANTSSSRTALARNNRVRLATQMQANQLYGAKENAETQLINQDRMNQQQVANANADAYTQWNNSVTDFNNKILDAKGENTIGLISGLNSSVQDILTRREKRNQFNENLKIISAANPNVSDELLRELGITSVDKAKKNKVKKNKTK